VIIEMQKASFPEDIPRFRGYLGKQYADRSNLTRDADDKTSAMRIYSIYFLGKDLEICDTPVLSVFPEIRDVATRQIVEKRSSFIEALTHKSWIVQISCLKQRRRNDLEILLSVFDQAHRSSDHHILNVSEEDFPDEHRPLIRRLKMAAADVAVKEQMREEEEVLDYYKDWTRSEIRKAEKKAVEEERKRFVINSRKAGLSPETVAMITGLTLEEIAAILKEHE
jgi:hypothetical protein